ncbi:MAG: c-type cytochrome [Hyphomicrobiaceae bacterium]
MLPPMCSRRIAVVVIIAAAAIAAGADGGLALGKAWAQTASRTNTVPQAVTPLHSKTGEPQATAGNLVGHGGPVKAIAVNAGQTRVATGSFDYSIALWDVTRHPPALLRRLADFEGAVNAVAFVPHRDLIVAGGDDGILRVWQPGSGEVLAALKGHKAKINAVAVSDDGRWAVTASWDRTARLWSLETLQAGPELVSHTGPVNAVQFSSDGRTVYTASYGGSIVSWRTADGARLATVLKQGWGINVLLRLPGQKADRLLYGTLTGAIGIVAPRHPDGQTRLPQHVRPVLAAAALAQPGLVATGDSSGVIHVFRADDGVMLETYTNPLGPVWAMAFVDHGAALYFGGLDDAATRWQISPRAAFEPAAGDYPRRFQVSEGVSLGERQFARKCSVCHTLGRDGRNRAGPSLGGVFGRRAGTLPGYPFSDALKGSGIVWNDDTIGKLFALGPDTFTPGSKMPLQRITDVSHRKALIEYLKAATRPSAGSSAREERGVETK